MTSGLWDGTFIFLPHCTAVRGQVGLGGDRVKLDYRDCAPEFQGIRSGNLAGVMLLHLWRRYDSKTTIYDAFLAAFR